SLSNGQLQLNRAGGGAQKLDWTHFVKSDGIALPTLAFTNTLDLHIAGTATVTLAGLFTATGTGSLDEGQVSGTDSTTSQTLTNAQALALTLNTSAAAGGLGSASASLHLVSLTQGTKSWLGVDASGINLSLTVDPLSLSLSNGELQLNRATGGAQKLDWTHFTKSSGITLPTLAFTNTLDLHVSGTVTVTFTGLFTATGTGSLDEGQISDAAVGNNAQLLAIALDASVGGGGSSASATVHLVSITQGAQSWLGIDASGVSLSFVVAPLTLSIGNGVLQLNRANGGASKLNWQTFTTAHTNLPTIAVADTVDLHVSGTATVTLPGFFTVTASGSLDLGQITDTSTVVGTNAQLLALSLTASAAGGGISAGGTVHLVSITQGAKSWLGVDASGINLSFDVSPLTLSVTNGVLQLNRANGGTTKLNWQTFTTAHTKLPTIAVTDTVDLHVSGTVAVALPGLFPANANGSLDLGQITDTAVGTDAQFLALALDASAAGGNASLSATVHLVSITHGPKSWLGVDASGINLSFTLDPLTLSLSDGVLQLNRANGGATKLNWQTFTTAHTNLPTIAVLDTTDLHVSGTATLSLPGLFTATGTGSIDLGQVTDAATVGTNAQVPAVSLDTSASGGGIGSVSATLHLVSITQGAKTWLGADGSGISLSLAIEPLTLSVTDASLKLNRAGGGATKLN